MLVLALLCLPVEAMSPGSPDSATRAPAGFALAAATLAAAATASISSHGNNNSEANELSDGETCLQQPRKRQPSQRRQGLCPFSECPRKGEVQNDLAAHMRVVGCGREIADTDIPHGFQRCTGCHDIFTERGMTKHRRHHGCGDQSLRSRRGRPTQVPPPEVTSRSNRTTRRWFAPSVASGSDGFPDSSSVIPATADTLIDPDRTQPIGSVGRSAGMNDGDVQVPDGDERASVCTETTQPLPPRLLTPVPHSGPEHERGSLNATEPLSSCSSFPDMPLRHPRPVVTTTHDFINTVDMKILYASTCPRLIPARNRKALCAAVERVCARILASEAGSEEEEKWWKMLIALPKVVFAKWEPKATQRSLSNQLIASFPDLEPELSDRVISGMCCTTRDTPSRDGGGSDSHRLRAVKRHLSEGEVAKAAKILVSEGVATPTDDILEKLRSLHPEPYSCDPPVPPDERIRFPGGFHSLRESAWKMEKVVQHLPSSSAPGPSGWSYAMVKQLYPHSQKLQQVLQILTQRIALDDKVPAKEWLTTSALIPLIKERARMSLRPVACGEVFGRIICRWALTAVIPSKYLLREQYGVGTPGGPETLIWSASDAVFAMVDQNVDLNLDPEELEEFVSLDFSNAFNTLSRHATASAIKENVPQHLGFFRFFYGTPSTLLVKGKSGAMHEIVSAEGGRQGDPLFPFWFSLTIRPLVERISSDFAKHSIVMDSDGNRVVNSSIWAYLDDVDLIKRRGKKLRSLLEMMGSKEVGDKYGLKLNILKCKNFSAGVMKSTGCPMLGSWIGGPDNESSPASALTKQAAATLRSRVDLLTHNGDKKGLTLAESFVVLRMCWFPTLNYLLRTLHPEVGLQGTNEFDDIIWNTFNHFIQHDNSVWEQARDVISLPLRLHGAGLFNQSSLKPIAAACSYVQARGFLRSVNLNLSSDQDDRMKIFVKQCADNLHLPVHEVFSSDFWKEKNLQRRAMEVVRERKWKEVFSQLPSTAEKIRFVEGSGPLARAWLQLPLTRNPFRLGNEQTRFKLRELVGSQFLEAFRPGTNVCPSCNRHSNANLHFLSCAGTQGLRTRRHTSVKNAITEFAQTAGAGNVRPEKVVGVQRDGSDLKADFVATVNGERENFDVEVTTVNYENLSIRWPSADQVRLALEEDKARGPALPPLFFWEDHSDESPHPETNVIRKFRQLASARVVGAAVRRGERDKTRKYGAVSVYPLVFTAGGGISQLSKTFFDNLCVMFDAKDVGKQSKFRKEMVARVSLSITRFGASMLAMHADNANLQF